MPGDSGMKTYTPISEIHLTDKELESLIQERIERCKEVLFKKSEEYSSESDRMRNFNTAGRMLGIPPYKVAFMYMMKHFESVYEIVINDQPASPTLWEEKITDLINYLLLIDAMWRKSYEDTLDHKGHLR